MINNDFFSCVLSDVLKTWWPPPTSLQCSLRVFYRLPTRQRCLKRDLSSEFWSYAPSLKILTYSVITLSSCLDSITLKCICADCISKTFTFPLHSLGVVPKAVMDSMEFLMNFHFMKDTKRGHRKRHSFRGKYNGSHLTNLKPPMCIFYFTSFKYSK